MHKLESNNKLDRNQEVKEEIVINETGWRIKIKMREQKNYQSWMIGKSKSLAKK